MVLLKDGSDATVAGAFASAAAAVGEEDEADGCIWDGEVAAEGEVREGDGQVGLGIHGGEGRRVSSFQLRGGGEEDSRQN